MNDQENISALQKENEELRHQLLEARNIIEAIKEGEIDALILDRGKGLDVYSIESADFTYRKLIERIGEGAVSITADGLIVYCNNYFANLFNLSPKQIIGTYFNSYVDTVGEFQQLKSSLANGTNKGELVLKHAGKKVPVYASITDLNPAVPALGMIFTDLTEKKKHEEDLALYQRKLEVKINELNQTNSNLEEFIHVVSHDVKEPVRKILVFSGHLTSSKEEMFDEAELKKLNSIRSSATRLNSLVDDLVKYSLHTHKGEFELLNLNEILKDVIDDLSILISDNAVIMDYSKLPTSINGSEIQIRQLFSNLLTNSIKYRRTEERPKIKITSANVDNVDPHFPAKQFYKITVEDNGIGMQKNEIGRIFTMFQRLHMPNEYSGNGIGLAICKKIIENHLGKIEVESSPGEGTIFTLFFPIKK